MRFENIKFKDDHGVKYFWNMRNSSGWQYERYRDPDDASLGSYSQIFVSDSFTEFVKGKNMSKIHLKLHFLYATSIRAIVPLNGMRTIISTEKECISLDECGNERPVRGFVGDFIENFGGTT
jgi:hypothetical protein